MVNHNLIASLSVEEQEAEAMIAEALGQAVADGDMEGLLEGTIGDFSTGTILQGKIIGHAGDDFLVDVGLKSEGILDKHEFDDPKDIEVGDTVEVLLEEVEGDGGTVVVSKRKADRIRGWEKIISTNDEGDVVEGKVMRKIKGGLLVDIGVPVFLPAS